jgi:DNA polymerase-3 subunit gamma/tau
MVNITLSPGEGIAALEERIKKLEDVIKSGKIQVASNSDKKSAPKKIAPIISKEGDGPKTPIFDVSKEPDKVQVSKYNINEIRENWGTILGNTKKNKVTLYAFLVEGEPISIVGKILNIGFKDNFGFHVSAISKAENKSEIEKIIYNVIGYKVSVNCDFASSLSNEDVSVSSTEEEKEKLMKFFGDNGDKVKIEE